MNAKLDIRDALLIQRMSHWLIRAKHGPIGNCPKWRGKKNYLFLVRKHKALAERHHFRASHVYSQPPTMTTHACCYHQCPEEGTIILARTAIPTRTGFVFGISNAGIKPAPASSLTADARWKNSENCWRAGSRYNAAVPNPWLGFARDAPIDRIKEYQRCQ